MKTQKCTGVHSLAGSIRPPLLPLQGGREGKGATSLVQHLSQNGVDNTYDYWLSKVAKVQQINDIIACGLLANVHLREAYRQYMQLSSQNGHVGTRGASPRNTCLHGGQLSPGCLQAAVGMGRPVIVRIVSHPTTWGSLTATAFLPKVGHPRDSVSLLGFVLLWQNRENVKGGRFHKPPHIAPFHHPIAYKENPHAHIAPSMPNQPA